MFSLVVAIVHGLGAPTLALAAALAAVGAAQLPIGEVKRRLVPMGLVMLLVVAFVPWAVRGEPLVQFGPWGYSREGVQLAGIVALKGIAIVLAVLALLGTMEITSLGHALRHLRVPEKGVHLLLLTVRYLGVLHREYLQLRVAMKARGFRLRMDVHTYRTIGHLVGMLLVRSLDRAERILAAMKCRGFRGHFYMLDHFAFSAARDLPFGLASIVVLLAVAWVGWR